jgi:ABC-type oligopeptide transport system substrate-binding subunit
MELEIARFLKDREQMLHYLAQHPNGTGPFELQQWQPDQLLVLRRNDNYYGDKAKLNQVVFHLYSGNPMNLYQEGTQDAAVLPLYFGCNYVVIKPYVKDYSLSLLGYPLLNKVSVEK